jgi:hypothetical protein
MSDNAPKVLLRSEEGSGQVAIVELAGGGRPPLHHHDFDDYPPTARVFRNPSDTNPWEESCLV